MSLVELRQLALERRGDGGQIGLGRLDGRARLQPRGDVEIVAAAKQVNRLGDRRPEVGRYAGRPGRELEARRDHADDRERLAVENDCFSGDGRIGAETLPPEPFAQHRDLALARQILFRSEPAAQEHRHAHDVEESGGHADAEERRRFARARENDASGIDHGRHALERLIAALPFRELVRADDVPIRVVAPLPGEHEAIGIAEGRRREEDGVDDAEDRGRRADRDAHQRGDARREARRAPDDAQSGLRVVVQRGQRAPA